MKRVRVPANERLLAILFCGGTLTGLALFKWVDPVHSAWFPPCPLHGLTGLHCAGCGTTRAIDSLLGGSLRQAFACNPLFIALCPWFAVWGMNQLAIAATGFGLAFKRLPTWVGWSVLALALAYMVLRNIPIEATAWMRPHML